MSAFLLLARKHRSNGLSIFTRQGLERQLQIGALDLLTEVRSENEFIRRVKINLFKRLVLPMESPLRCFRKPPQNTSQIFLRSPCASYDRPRFKIQTQRNRFTLLNMIQMRDNRKSYTERPRLRSIPFVMRKDERKPFSDIDSGSVLAGDLLVNALNDQNVTRSFRGRLIAPKLHKLVILIRKNGERSLRSLGSQPRRI